jgi:Reverse transcriptase (RNA-dependent DNA polymerase)
VDSAYLYGTLKEEIYMEQPEGFVDKDHPDYVWRLIKALYGLKQAGKCWNEDVNAYLLKLGFVVNKADACIYSLKRSDGTYIYLGLYVDDIIALCKTFAEYQWLVGTLKAKYAIKELGLAKYILGVAILRDGKSFVLSQRNYLLNILEEFGMGDCNPLHTPTCGGDMGISLKVEDPHLPQDRFTGQAEVPGTKKPSQAPSIELEDPTIYRSVVGKLNYAMVATRPDLAFSVSLLGKFMAHPTQASWELAKRVLRYVKHTADYGLFIGGKDEFPSKSHGFSDADHAGDRDDRKSITGFMFYIFGSPVSWNSRKQQTVALSTTEAEYMAQTESTKEAVWIRRFLEGMGYVLDEPTVIYGDNQGAMALAKNPIDHQRTKHIDVKYHFTRDKVEEKVVDLRYVSSAEQTADIFTKPLVKKIFEYHREKLGVKSTSSLWGSVSRQT